MGSVVLKISGQFYHPLLSYVCSHVRLPRARAQLGISSDSFSALCYNDVESMLVPEYIVARTPAYFRSKIAYLNRCCYSMLEMDCSEPPCLNIVQD